MPKFKVKCATKKDKDALMKYLSSLDKKYLTVKDIPDKNKAFLIKADEKVAKRAVCRMVEELEKNGIHRFEGDVILKPQSSPNKMLVTGTAHRLEKDQRIPMGDVDPKFLKMLKSGIKVAEFHGGTGTPLDEEYYDAFEITDDDLETVIPGCIRSADDIRESGWLFASPRSYLEDDPFCGHFLDPDDDYDR